jgi:hypothetical protein
MEFLHSEILRSHVSPQQIVTKEDRPDTSVPIFLQHLVRDALPVNLFFVTTSFPLELIFLFLPSTMSLSAIMRGGGAGMRSPASTGEAAGTGVESGAADAPGTTAVSATGSSLFPETGIGVLDSVGWTGRDDEGRWTS